MLKLIDDENEEIKFQDKVKQFPIVNFLLEFLTWVNRSKKPKRLGKQYIKDVLVELEKDFSAYDSNKRQGNTQVHSTRLLKLTNTKYQKLFEENKILKEKIEAVEKEKSMKREQTKWKDNIK